MLIVESAGPSTVIGSSPSTSASQRTHVALDRNAPEPERLGMVTPDMIGMSMIEDVPLMKKASLASQVVSSVVVGQDT